MSLLVRVEKEIYDLGEEGERPEVCDEPFGNNSPIAPEVSEETGEVSPELQVYQEEPSEDQEITQFNAQEEPRVDVQGGGMFEHTSVPDDSPERTVVSN